MDYFEEEYMRQMSSRIGCLPILLLCIALSFVGCKTIRQTEYVAIHDTLHVHHSDTVREYTIKTVHDTIRESSNHILTLNEKGDTIREYHYYHEKEKIVEKDSTDKYKSSIDSLKSVLNKIHEKEKVTEKKPSFHLTSLKPLFRRSWKRLETGFIRRRLKTEKNILTSAQA